MSAVAMALVGPTASGKSALAMALARQHPGLELVSVDSMQVYRGMDIGTAKPSAAEQAEIPHHLIDVVDAADEYTVSCFAADVTRALDDIAVRGRRALLVGGTGLYLRAALGDLELPARFPEVRVDLEAEPETEQLHGRLQILDPVAASRIQPNNRRRVVRALEVTLGSGRPFSSYGPGLESYRPVSHPIVALAVGRPELDRRIEARFEAQMAAGFVDEVQGLRARPGGLSATAGQALGYRELGVHLDGRLELDEAVTLAITRTRRFQRRQDRWFRRDPRLTWVDPGDKALAMALARLED
jgi:tRNA dimethylallyltransferase